MRLLFAALSLFATSALAAPTYWQQLNDGELQAPRLLIAKMEQQFTGVVTQFDIREQQHHIRYDIDVIDPLTKTCHQLQLSGRSGKLITQTAKDLPDNDAQLQLAQHLLQHRMAMSQVLRQALLNHSGKLLSAQLDRGLGISYVELKLLNAAGSQRLAYDIDHRRQMPLLKWN